MSSDVLSELIDVGAAIEIVDRAPLTPRTIVVPLDDALGLRIAQDLFSDRDYPPFVKSLMDGYAVRTADVSAGAALKVVGEVAAGQISQRALGAGEVMAIMTGAPLPPGADGVVPVEQVQSRAPVGGVVRILQPGTPSRFIAARGSDCAAGAVVLRRGSLIGPAQVAVAASVGATNIACFARPRVAILGTGDELVGIEQTPGPAQIRDSNTHMLRALLTRLGCEVIGTATAPDSRPALREAIERGLEADALFISGGMSMGEHDHVPRLLAEIGAEMKIAKLRIKPGKPFLFATRGVKFIFGLPGNPLSGFVTTIRLASRVLARLAGGSPQEDWRIAATTEALASNGPRELYQPAVLGAPPAAIGTAPAVLGTEGETNSLPALTPLPWKGSADLFTLAQANALLVRPENDPALPAGAVVRALMI